MYGMQDDIKEANKKIEALRKFAEFMLKEETNKAPQNIARIEWIKNILA